MDWHNIWFRSLALIGSLTPCKLPPPSEPEVIFSVVTLSELQGFSKRFKPQDFKGTVLLEMRFNTVKEQIVIPKGFLAITDKRMELDQEKPRGKTGHLVIPAWWQLAQRMQC